MKLKDLIKKRSKFFLITLFIILLIIIVSVIVFNNNSKNKDNIKEDRLTINYNINKVPINPMNKEDGLLNAGDNTITIKNNTNDTINYKLVIKTDNDNNALSLDKIYYSINGEVNTLDKVDNNIVYTNSINKKDEVILTFKIWVGLDLITNEDQGKVIRLEYIVDEI